MTSDILTGPDCFSSEENPSCSGITSVLEPVEKDLGSFVVRRLLPAVGRKMVGPFVFFDHLGPVTFPPGEGIDVRPHPHIGLATITYLFEGEIVHRDNLGEVQTIRKNEINLMTAGRGIAHSERTGPELRNLGHTLHALQLWIALPSEHETCDPAFNHYESAQLPTLEQDGVALRVLMGSAFGLRSEVSILSPALFVEATLAPGARLTLPDDMDERAVYLISGAARALGHSLTAKHMTIFDAKKDVTVTADEETRLVIIGGDSVGKRTVWWNLVASDKELIEQAKSDWREGRFATVPGETEFIPLP
jgi:redox-sensitive bicupin YhaK (pirin superfamily)